MLAATFPARAGLGLEARFPWVDSPAIDILARMLRFGAHERISAEEALGHALFADMRGEEEETAAAAPIAALGFEREGSPDERCLRRHFVQEVRWFRGPEQWEEAAGGAAGGA
mmetsp:Transcript_99480/g.315761  ORF Transcript_99480/g.315761 Transcript_99480/m.315761 type:complete len:113 (+) Transcript_99480:1026-1364(+)